MPAYFSAPTIAHENRRHFVRDCREGADAEGVVLDTDCLRFLERARTEWQRDPMAAAQLAGCDQDLLAQGDIRIGFVDSQPFCIRPIPDSIAQAITVNMP